ncbi:MAG: universal stress protein [Gammaproteobacteria bacterium]
MTTSGPIVHPTDFTRASEAAFIRAIDLAKRDGAELILAHVLEPLSPFLADGSSVHYTQLQASLEAKARLNLKRMLVRARRAAVPASDVLLEGSPAERIMELAKKRSADVIVMGTRGRTGFKKLLLGSVAERVIGLAPCAVLTVRGQ